MWDMAASSPWAGRLIKHNGPRPACDFAPRFRPAYDARVSTVNPLAREISAKIVYYGPGLSGKTTSLQRVYDFVRPENRGQLISLNTEGDRTLFFDFLPLKVEQVRGLSLRLQLYTVPGQVFYDATRKLVLNGADGVVFVADSQPAAHDRNQESMANLRENLAELGIDLDVFPLVVEYNKRDLPNVMPLEPLRRDLNPRGVPDFETIASKGVNIMPALKEITRLVMVDLRARQPAPRKRMASMEAKGSHGSDLANQITAAAARGGQVATAWPPVHTPSPARIPAPSQIPAPPRSPTSPEIPISSAPTPAPSTRTPEPPPRGPDPATPLDLTFTRLFPGRGDAIDEVEHAIRERTFGVAVRGAAEGLAELLEHLFSGDDQPADRAALLGIDGHDYLRLSLLAAKPDPAVSEQDALFALHILVGALLKAERK
jgi:signal recognition particle receptor subunit beta